MDSRYDSKKGRFVMKKNTGERPLITGQLKVGSQTFNIVAYSWVSFLFEINQMKTEKRNYHKRRVKEWMAIQRKKDKRERNREQNREWRKNNPDKVKQYSKKYYKNNRDKINKYYVKYRRRKKNEQVQTDKGNQ